MTSSIGIRPATIPSSTGPAGVGPETAEVVSTAQVRAGSASPAATGGRPMSPFVVSDAVAGLGHLDFVKFLERGELTMDDPQHSGVLGRGINGDVRYGIVEDPVNPSRWAEVAVHRTDQGGAFNKLVHDVAVAANLEDSVIPVGRNDGVFVSARHAGTPLDQVHAKVGDVHIDGIAGSSSLRGTLQATLEDSGAGSRIARVRATHAVQGAQLVNAIAATPDAHAGNHLASFGAAADLRANDFGIMDRVDQRSGLPILKPDYMKSVRATPSMAAAPTDLPDGASFTQVDPEVLQRLRGIDRTAVRAAEERFRADIAGTDEIGSTLADIVDSNAVPDGARTVELTIPDKVGVVGKVSAPAEGLADRMLGRIDDIVASDGIRFMTRAAINAR